MKYIKIRVKLFHKKIDQLSQTKDLEIQEESKLNIEQVNNKI